MIKHGRKVVDTIFIHCAATRPDWMEDKPLAAKVAEIKRWHLGRGWNDIGYHWIIDRDGSYTAGRDEDVPGSHVVGHNAGSIGICLIGGHGANENDAFSKHFTPDQEHTLRALIDDIKERTPIKKVRGHNEVAAKACPGFNVARWLKGLPATRALKESTTMKASVIQLAAGGGAATSVAALGGLDGNAQIVALVLIFITLLATAWIMRERIRKWVRETHE